MFLPVLLLPAAASARDMYEDGSDSSGNDDASEEEVDSDGSLFRADSPDPLAGDDNDIIWMPSGDMERVGKIAYGYINIDGPSDNPAESSSLVLVNC
jgi:hypothetical protein